MKNELFIASAGAGKTTHFVKKALTCTGTVLLTTFTEENEREIRKKFVELNNGVVPANITIQTWFSFLIEHGVKPYQGKLTEKRITGLLLVNEKSGLKFKGKFPQYYPEKNVDKYYFTNDYKIYSDKISKFVFECNKKSNNSVVERISALFQNIFIDEIQDMAGYDLELIKLLMNTNSAIKMAGDPRQVTYHTHFSRKNKKYSNGKIQDFILNECKETRCSIDTDTLKASWRNNQCICDFANKIFPDQSQCESLQNETTDHDGVYFVYEKDIEKYIEKYQPLQLRFNRNAKNVLETFEVKNYGESKGTTYDRVIIYPTQKILDWVINGTEIDSFEVKCKFYVAVTRAKFSVAIVCNNQTTSNVLPIYQF